MNVPFVKVNNQQELRVVIKMQRNGFARLNLLNVGLIIFLMSLEQIAIPTSHFYKLIYEDKQFKVISADEYLAGIKENFTLDDLEDGMVVEASDGELFLVLSGFLVNNGIKYSNDILNTFDENFEHKQYR